MYRQDREEPSPSLLSPGWWPAYALLAFGAFGFYFSEFVPAPWLRDSGWLLAAMAGALATWALPREALRARLGERPLPLPVLLGLLLVALSLAAWYALVVGLPAIANEALGQRAEETVVVHGEVRQRRRSCDARLYGPIAQNLPRGYLCVPRDLAKRYTSRPGPAILVLRRSALGARILRATPAPETAAAGS